MALTTDAQVSQIMECRPIKKMSRDCLREVLLDLDEDEVVSLMFLLWNEDTDVSIKKFLDSNPEQKLEELLRIQNWQTKLIEALLIMKNIHVLRRLGFSKEDIAELNIKFCISIHNVSISLSRVMKSLYFLCDSLTQKQTKALINAIQKKTNQPVDFDGNNRFLEICILNWNQNSLITITQDSPDLDNLLKELKDLGYYSTFEPDFNFDYWKDTGRKNVPTNSITYEPGQRLEKFWPEDRRKLCIIINEMHFNDCEKYKTRRGSDVDAKSLRETFQGLGFIIKEEKDLYANEFINLLDHLENDSSYSTYGAIFICILSHGMEGRVIFSDGTDVPIKTIQNKICCKNMQNVFKFIILQSCQGEKKGSELVTDGPTSSEGEASPLNHVHFGIFHSTISDYVSWRDESEGSWFVQDVCRILQDETPLNVTEWIQKVKQSVISRRSILPQRDSGLRYAVQVPCFYEIIPYDYSFPKYDPSRCVQ